MYRTIHSRCCRANDSKANLWRGNNSKSCMKCVYEIAVGRINVEYRCSLSVPPMAVNWMAKQIPI